MAKKKTTRSAKKQATTADTSSLQRPSAELMHADELQRLEQQSAGEPKPPG